MYFFFLLKIFQVCKEVTKTEIETITENECKTITEEQCEESLPAYSDANPFIPVYGEKCRDITEEICTPELVEVCDEESAEPECITIYDDVPETKCILRF